MRAAIGRLADEGVFIGTSSWKYRGWCGQLYQTERYLTRGKFSEARFERECLSEYAELFRTVGVDAGYYAFPAAAAVEAMIQQTPPGFLFCFKVTDEITIRQFPKLDRFGPRAGKSNPHFLDARLFREAFLGPLERHRDRIGVLMFEFSQMRPFDESIGAVFVAELDSFLAALPAGWQYGVEVRNEGLLGTDYFSTLRRHRVAHVFNSWERMPPVAVQSADPESRTADFLAARFLLKPGRSYESAVELFSPYDSVKDPAPDERAAGARLVEEARRRGRKRSFFLINNRLEGNALETIRAIVRQVLSA